MFFSQCYSTTSISRSAAPLSQFKQTYVSPPTNDTQTISSNYARYILSYFTIVRAQEQEQDDDQNKVFWSITEKCLLYLKRQPLNTYENDQIIGHSFSHFFDMSKLAPTPSNQIGDRLMKNGYFLAAYAQLLSRLKASKLYLKYFAQIYAKYQITMGRSELFHYLGAENSYAQLLQKESNERKTVEKPLVRKRIEQLQYSVKTCP